MTTSINTILKNRKNRKNKKGFSLVELIVVLVIMAILAAALVPTLIGYINQTRQSNAKNEAAACVQATQTIVSSAYATPNSIYINNTDSGQDIKLNKASGGWTLTVEPSTATHTVTGVIEKLAEVNPGTVSNVTVDTNGVVSGLTYASPNGETITYSTSTGKGVYSVS